ncbi:MAG: hypothetical protein K0Q94_1408 [Paenibacillus sp.]|uniref:hypothetical protein n=1 Tax=Paenibacillus sp. GCM10012303 TaxID=3317340 RepID=UPI0029EB13D8|nr:hypothetical protein [Paenibacillus sp.]
MITYLAWLIVLVSAVGFVLTVIAGRKQREGRFDQNTNATTAKHPFLANPIVIAYVVFPVLAVVAAVMLWLYV